ncbi:MAG: hypothetical protein AAF943_17405, partial [Pseudomonadota bacterium]
MRRNSGFNSSRCDALHRENPSNPKDGKTASFQRREPFAMNPFVAACLKPLNFPGFIASGAGLM